MNIGIGYVNRKDSFSSAVSVAEDALRNGGFDRADFAIAFCSGKHDHESFFKGMQSVLGESVPIVGGSAAGIITNRDLSYEGHPAGVIVLSDSSLEHAVQYTTALDENERQAGITLASKQHWRDDFPLLLFYDSIKTPPTELSPPEMNSSAPLLEGLESVFSTCPVVLGAGLVGDFNFTPVDIFCGDVVKRQAAVCAQLYGDFGIRARIMHGCTPLDGVYHTITHAEGQVVFEVDGMPVAKMIDDIYGHCLWRSETPVQLVTFGVHQGQRFSLPEEKHYVNRIIMSAIPGSDAVLLFESDLKEGDEIQFMLRDTEEMNRSARINTEALVNEVAEEGQKILFGLYIDCAGRANIFSNSEAEEAAEVQKIFNRIDTPLFGFFSGVEIAPFIEKNRGLDWTGVLIVFTGDGDEKKV